jgi:hypothetical protein
VPLGSAAWETFVRVGNLLCVAESSARAAVCGGLLAMSLGLTGCPGPEPEAPPVRFEVGTGRRFTAIEDGATLELVRGSQGGQHVFVSLRAWNLTDTTARVEMSLERTSDGRKVSSDYAVNLRFTQGPGADEPALLEGLLLVVPDPTLAVGHEVRLKASFLSSYGQRGEDSRTGTVQWAASFLP